MVLLGDGFILDRDLQVRSDILVQLHRHGELAESLEGLVQLDLAPVEIEAFLAQRVSDIAGGNRPEQLIVLTGAPLESNREAVELLGQFFRLRLFLGGAANLGSLHLFNDGFVAFGRFNGELLGQQEIAAISFGNFDHVAAGTQFGYIFFENDCHG